MWGGGNLIETAIEKKYIYLYLAIRQTCRRRQGMPTWLWKSFFREIIGVKKMIAAFSINHYKLLYKIPNWSKISPNFLHETLFREKNLRQNFPNTLIYFTFSNIEIPSGGINHPPPSPNPGSLLFLFIYGVLFPQRKPAICGWGRGIFDALGGAKKETRTLMVVANIL